MKLYKAEGSFRQQHRVTVYVDGELSGLLRHDVEYSPDGHAWGYGGSGPNELAKDLLWDVLGERPDRQMSRRFLEDVIANLPQNEGWALSENEIRLWIAKYETEEAQWV